MASLIKPKRRHTDATAPTTGDLTAEGEFAINTFDKRIYARDNSNNIVILGIQDGTGTNNILRWDGSDWVETSVIAVSTTGSSLGGSGDVSIVPTGNVLMGSLPTSDPVVAGALWNDSGTLKVSTG